MMSDIGEIKRKSSEGQCLFFVVRKKRLCRMTVRPGRNYCGEHEPQPRAEEEEIDTRIPCPNDPKHTVYASKLEKHLSICNARHVELPYIIHNINAPAGDGPARVPLAQVSPEALRDVVDKINRLYEEHIAGTIAPLPEFPIHAAVVPLFTDPQRTEASRRHLRQASALLHLTEAEGLVRPGTCYVELGAGKGQLSYFAGVAWPDPASRTVLVDRACLRHKRDGRLRAAAVTRVTDDETRVRGDVTRVRADLRHLVLEKVPEVQGPVLGMAKHLCGVAMDYALRCVASRARGVVLATCCHHRCERPAYVGNHQLQELGITAADFNVMLSVVSWATCGDGRSRDKRQHKHNGQNNNDEHTPDISEKDVSVSQNGLCANNSSGDISNGDSMSEKDRVSMDEVSERISVSKESESASKDQYTTESLDENVPDSEQNISSKDEKVTLNSKSDLNENTHAIHLTQQEKEVVGRRAKALVDFGRVLFLRERGFDARMVYYVPTAVSLENVCIVAKKVD